METKGILFNTYMVQALLEGRKNVTRRVIKPQPKMRLCYACMGSGHGKWSYPSETAWKYWGDEWKITCDLSDQDRNRLWTPPCHTDDILYVRETWAPMYKDMVSKEVMGYLYLADREGCYGQEYVEKYDEMYPDGKDWTWEGRWRPSIHMPQSAARIWLRVTHVTVEKLQDMHAQDSLDEGVKLHLKGLTKGDSPLKPFQDVWDSTLTKKEQSLYGWDANPWVWRIDFERLEGEQA